MDWLATAAMLTAIGSVGLGVTAEVNRRRAVKHADASTRRSEAWKEMQAVQTEQRTLLDLYRQENGRLQAEIVGAETKADAALAAHADCETKVAALIRKLHEMDARVTELGG